MCHDKQLSFFYIFLQRLFMFTKSICTRNTYLFHHYMFQRYRRPYEARSLTRLFLTSGQECQMGINVRYDSHDC